MIVSLLYQNTELIVDTVRGGSIISLTTIDFDNNKIPIFYKSQGLASFILAPFSNRIKNEFTYNNVLYKISANDKQDKYAIHGDAFRKHWDIVINKQNYLKLSLNNGDIAPFKYKAIQEFQITERSLLQKLSITNQAEIKLPYGAGFHPFFYRKKDTKLKFNASSYWLTDTENFPYKKVDLKTDNNLNFSNMKGLGNSWLNYG